MKVRIKEIRTGRIKLVDKKYADVLVKIKNAEYHKETAEKSGAYRTKDMSATPAPEPAPPPAPTPTPEPTPTPNPTPAPAPEVPPTPEAAPAVLEPKKRGGRPPKKKDETKV